MDGSGDRGAKTRLQVTGYRDVPYQSHGHLQTVKIFEPCLMNKLSARVVAAVCSINTRHFGSCALASAIVNEQTVISTTDRLCYTALRQGYRLQAPLEAPLVGARAHRQTVKCLETLSNMD